jgi:hypothetical protein
MLRISGLFFGLLFRPGFTVATIHHHAQIVDMEPKRLKTVGALYDNRPYPQRTGATVRRRISRKTDNLIAGRRGSDIELPAMRTCPIPALFRIASNTSAPRLHLRQDKLICSHSLIPFDQLIIWPLGNFVNKIINYAVSQMEPEFEVAPFALHNSARRTRNAGIPPHNVFHQKFREAGSMIAFRTTIVGSVILSRWGDGFAP